VPIIYAQYLYWYWYLKVRYWYLYWYLLVEYLIQDCLKLCLLYAYSHCCEHFSSELIIIPISFLIILLVYFLSYSMVSYLN